MVGRTTSRLSYVPLATVASLALFFGLTMDAHASQRAVVTGNTNAISNTTVFGTASNLDRTRQSCANSGDDQNNCSQMANNGGNSASVVIRTNNSTRARREARIRQRLRDEGSVFGEDQEAIDAGNVNADATELVDGAATNDSLTTQDCQNSGLGQDNCSQTDGEWGEDNGNEASVNIVTNNETRASRLSRIRQRARRIGGAMY